MNTESTYWLFSSSSQAIASIIAFLLAGYAVILEIMDSSTQGDETLQEIRDEFRSRFHFRMKIIASLTGAAIIGSLIVIHLNARSLPWLGWLALFVFLLNVAAVVSAIWFVIYFTNPSRYSNLANALYQKQTKVSPPGKPTTPRGIFLEAFIELENLIRTYVKKKRLILSPLHFTTTVYSLRQMLESLLEHRLISKQQYDSLLNINGIRNLVVHGQLKEVESSYLEQVQSLSSILSQQFQAGKRPAA